MVSGILNASKRLNCVFLFTIDLHSLVNLHVSFLCFLQPKTSKNAIPGDIAFEFIQKSQHAFLSSLNLLALRARISLLKHCIGSVIRH